MGIAFPTSRLSPTMWVSLSAALGAAAAAFAGLYPQLDGGKLRPILAITSAAFAAPLAAWATRATTRGRAAGRTIGVAMVLGVAASVLPAMVLLLPDAGIGAVIYGVMMFGVVLGSVTGLLYGAPLALLAAIGARRDGSHDAVDRVQRGSGLWLAGIAAFSAILSTSPVLSGNDDYGPLPTSFAASVALLGAGWALVAHVRLARRTAWLARVRDGHEPGFRLRAPDAHDDLASLPHLSSLGAVVEIVPEHETTAYRAIAVGSPVAVV